MLDITDVDLTGIFVSRAYLLKLRGEKQFYLKKYKDMGFSRSQLNEIALGLECNVDVALYAKKEWNEIEMEYVRRGQILGYDLSPYIKKLGLCHLGIVLDSLQKGIDFSCFIDAPGMTFEKMHIAQWGLLHGLDISDCIDNTYDVLSPYGRRFEDTPNGIYEESVEFYSDMQDALWITNDFPEIIQECIVKKCKTKEALRVAMEYIKNNPRVREEFYERLSAKPLEREVFWHVQKRHLTLIEKLRELFYRRYIF